MLDRSQLAAVAAGEPELVLEILEDFSMEAEMLISRAFSAEPSKAQDIFHQLAGSSGTLGLEAFSQLARELEQSIHGELMPEVSEIADLLKESVQQAKGFLLSLGEMKGH